MPDDAPTPPFHAVIALNEEQLNFLRRWLAKREWQIRSLYARQHRSLDQDSWHELVVLTQVRDMLK
jgi:hypothetical protein